MTGSFARPSMSALAGALLATALLVAMAPAAMGQPSNIPMEEPTNTDRVSGPSRFETAARLALDGYGEAGAPVAIVATGFDYPDALAANYLAGQLDQGEGGPILLTLTNSLPEATTSALAELGVERVLIMGGTSAVGPAVEQELAQRYDVERIGGRTRFETAAAVALAGDFVGELDGRRTALLATGVNWPDAMVGGSVAFAGEFPLLLTTAGQLHPASAQALAALDVEHVVILGGSGVISPDVEAELSSAGYSTERVSGSERTATAAEVARLAVERLGFDLTRVNLATGAAFPDALTGGPNAGKIFASPVLLTQRGGTSGVPGPEALGRETAEFLTENCAFIAAIRAFGGPEAIANDTLQAAEAAAQSCPFSL